MKLGAKISLKSKDLPELDKLVEIFDFIEVYYTSHHIFGSTIETIDTEWVVHCPHHEDFINLADEDRNDIDNIQSSINFASKIGAKLAIVHAGYVNNNEIMKKDFYTGVAIENLRRLNKFAKENKVRLLVENTPLKSVNNKIQIGTKPEELKHMLKKSGCGFVLDFPHAHHSSVSHKIDYKKFIKQFSKLKPVMYHLYDGYSREEVDTHLPLGKGDLDIPFFVSFIGKKKVTLEIDPPTLENYLDSRDFLNKIIRKKKV